MKVTRKSKNSANSQENDIDPANLRNLRSRTNQNLDHPKTPVKDGDRKNEDFDEGSMFYKIISYQMLNIHKLLSMKV